MEAAQRWGLTPSQWDSLSSEDRAQMVAYVRVTSAMAAWDAQVAQEEWKRLSKKK